MARPKKEVDQGNVTLISAYISRALNSNSKIEILKSGSKATAIEAFNKIAPDNVEAIQLWIDDWLTDGSRGRMWTSFRQKRYRSQHAVKMVSLSEEAFSLLSDYAKRFNVTLSQAIELLLSSKNDS